MQELLRRLQESLRSQRAVAWCRLIETRGSTPQKAGAAMLVYADGSQAGTLGGGCVEAEVKRRALQILEQGSAAVLRFQLDNDYGWDDGLICGGRMEVLVDPIRPIEQIEDARSADAADAIGYYQQLTELLLSGRGATEAVVLNPDQSELPATAAYLFDSDERLVASMRDSSPVDAVLTKLLPHLRPLDTRPSPQMVAGLALLPSLPRCRLLIVGAGHVGQAVARLAADLDFDVWVVDDRQEFLTEERLPTAERRICGAIGPTLKSLEITPSTYCLIVTRGHNHDEEALFHLVDRGARYVGMIGSKRKIRLIFDDLLNEGISADALANVYAPVGLEIGSQTVMEIAVSIAAELVAHRNLGGEVPGRAPASVTIRKAAAV